MVQSELSSGRVDEQRVVDRAALDLVRADGEPDGARTRDLREPVGVGAGDLERLLREPGEGRTPVAGLLTTPAREVPHPPVRRIHRDEGLREEGEARAGCRDL